MISVCVGQKKQRYICISSANAMTWDGLEEKKKTMDVIQRYVGVNDVVENEISR